MLPFERRVRRTGQYHFPLSEICWPVPRTFVIPIHTKREHLTFGVDALTFAPSNGKIKL